MSAEKTSAHGATVATTGVAATLHEAFVRYGDQRAVEIPAVEARLTYGRLWEEARAWADVLGPPDRPLVLYVHKTLDYYRLLACAFLYGYSVCLVDRSSPLGRLRRIVEQFAGPVLVTDDARAADALHASGVRTVRLPAGGRGASAAAVAPPSIGTSSAEQATQVPRYFISTSGTSGAPRLVDVRHDATLAFTAWSTRFYGCGPDTRWAQFSGNGFDLSLVDFLTVLRSGGTLVALTNSLERARPGRFIEEHGITHWHSVPTMIPYLLYGEADLASIECFTFCGEPLLRDSCLRLRRRAPGARLVNTYGPTEGTLFCSFHEVSAADLESDTATMPIGAPVPGWSFLFLPEQQTHRLVIAGEHLAEGYLQQQGGAFGTVTVGGESLRSFDTGDYFDLDGGAVRFSHRRDGMVKVRGNRVDVGEVADACAAYGVQQPVVVLREEELVLFHEDPHDRMDHRKLLAGLLERLPAYAAPSRIVAVAEIPRTANGKIDHSALVESERRQ